MTNQFLHLSSHTINPSQISYIDWDYREGAGDTQFIRIVLGCDEILLGVDSLDSKILENYVSSTNTKREQFAAIALQGLLANGVHRLCPADLYTIEPSSEARFAEVAVWLADALIAKLEKPNEPRT